MTRLRGIIFDKDGTLFDFSATWVDWADTFLHRIAADGAHAALLGKAIGFDVQARRFQPDSVAIAGTPKEVAEALRPHVQMSEFVDLVEVINAEAEQAPLAEAVPLLPCLTDLAARGLVLGIVTNDAETPARAHLEAAGVLECFDFIAGSDSGFGAKPEPGQLHAFAHAMDLKPDEVLMVGDSLHDLMAAQAARMSAIGVLTGLASAQELAPYALTVLPDIGHLPDWLVGQNLLID